MKKLIALVSVVVLVGGMALAGEAKKGEWTGTVSDSMCGAKANHSAECTKKCIAGGSKMVLVNDADKKLLEVANPDKLAGHEGHKVKVTGSVENDKLTVDTVAMM
ncbi:MAG TPA: hypothetical protein VNK82_01565 [Terriglobales bacterium]|nr:hypothetical protein [Terriglobales bacterium]